MTYPDRKFAALIGSRICHDLISPIGAINNGLELMALTGAPDGPELSLVSESAAAADARVRLFRLAFGLAAGTEAVPPATVRGILEGVYHGPVSARWRIGTALERPLTQACLLALMCAADTIPRAGTLSADGGAGEVRITADGPCPNHHEELWRLLDGHPPPPDIAPAQVHFALLAALLAEIGRPASRHLIERGVRITF